MRASWKSSLIVLVTICNLIVPATTSNFTIEKFAAIGDSYAAGVGNGERVGRRCGRYNQAYGYLVNENLKWKNETDNNFTFLACVGDTADMMIKTQLPKLDQNIDAMTITVGGNDIGFNSLVNDCIFGWLPRPMRRCDKTVDKSLILLEQFSASLDKMLAQAVKKLTPETGRIYITGYAKMFGTETNECDTVSWALWGAKKPLIRMRRIKFNNLADSLNAVIESSANRAGNQVVFVNYDFEFGMCKGRICEAGVKEPAPTRARLLFYERGGPPVALPPSVANLTTTIRGRAFTLGKLIPDRIMRTCHPRANAHRIIADLILWHMEVEKTKYMGLPVPPRPGEQICRLQIEPDGGKLATEAELMPLLQFLDLPGASNYSNFSGIA